MDLCAAALRRLVVATFVSGAIWLMVPLGGQAMAHSGVVVEAIPPTTRAFELEGSRDVTGTLQRVHAHLTGGETAVFWGLVERSSIVPVTFTGEMPDGLVNTRVRARGRVIDGIMRTRPDAMTRVGVATIRTVPKAGARKAALIIFHPSDEVGDENLALTEQYMFDASEKRSVNSYYKTQTFGRFSFPGDEDDIYGPYEVDPTPLGDDAGTGCHLLGAWSNEAANLAVAENPALFQHYDHFIYILETPDAAQRCSNTLGVGSQPGSTVFLNGFGDMVADHELGHNFGAAHAGTARCKAGSKFVTYVPGCDKVTSPLFTEYGDP